MNWLAKINRINIIINYCCTRVLFYAKMLKETETEETIVFFVIFLSLVAFQLGGGGTGYAYGERSPQPPKVMGRWAIFVTF